MSRGSILNEETKSSHIISSNFFKIVFKNFLVLFFSFYYHFIFNWLILLDCFFFNLANLIGLGSYVLVLCFELCLTY